MTKHRRLVAIQQQLSRERSTGRKLPCITVQVQRRERLEPRGSSREKPMEARNAAGLVLLDVCGIISTRESIPRFAARSWVCGTRTSAATTDQRLHWRGQGSSWRSLWKIAPSTRGSCVSSTLPGPSAFFGASRATLDLSLLGGFFDDSRETVVEALRVRGMLSAAITFNSRWILFKYFECMCNLVAAGRLKRNSFIQAGPIPRLLVPCATLERWKGVVSHGRACRCHDAQVARESHQRAMATFWATGCRRVPFLRQKRHAESSCVAEARLGLDGCSRGLRAWASFARTAARALYFWTAKRRIERYNVSRVRAAVARCWMRTSFRHVASVWHAREFAHTATSLGLLRAMLSLWRNLFLEALSLWVQHVIEGRGVLRRLKIASGPACCRRDQRSRASKEVRALEAIVKWQCQEAQLWSLGRWCRHKEQNRTMETSQRSRREGVLLRMCFDHWTEFQDLQCHKHSVHQLCDHYRLASFLESALRSSSTLHDRTLDMA